MEKCLNPLRLGSRQVGKMGKNGEKWGKMGKMRRKLKFALKLKKKKHSSSHLQHCY